MELAERFWAKVDTSGDCWEWTAYRDAAGMGALRLTAGRCGRIDLLMSWSTDQYLAATIITVCVYAIPAIIAAA